MKHSRGIIFFIVLIFLFALRLAYGLCSEFWFEDELQVYLIGLRYYTTGVFPYFGPDIVYTATQIPGALLGLLVGLPFFLVQIPEAPYILLNLLSFAVLCLFGAYLQKKFTETPSWFLWIWIMTCPWVMNLSTHVFNPSYVLFGSVLFFIGFFEAVRSLRIGFVKIPLAFFMMGFALFWVYQLHMSWVLLVPFVFYAFWKSFFENKLSVPAFFAGCLLPALLLLPAYFKFGFHEGGGLASNVEFNFSNVKEFFTLMLRYLSLASNEIPRFIDTDGASRLCFFRDYLYAVPFLLFAILSGFLQVAYMLISFFMRNPVKGFRQVKWILFFTLMFTWFSFFFSVKGPSSHTFYVLFPLVMLYSFYCWQPLFRKKWFGILMMLMLFSGIVTNITLAYHNYHVKSLYKKRELPRKAIQQKNYHILGERRASERNPE
ncbi:MAG: hypothetical protein PHR81_06735 [Bacteroidales bacterium]|jgi:hypothetical protein|nr:hypothetical protein [Bacteroidales bacterium]MDD4214491.1 hypothetical protein [Bacteroidales bacterium]